MRVYVCVCVRCLQAIPLTLDTSRILNSSKSSFILGPLTSGVYKLRQSSQPQLLMLIHTSLEALFIY